MNTKNNRILLTILFIGFCYSVILSTTAIAQERVCSGKVFDKKTGETLPFATIYLKSDKNIGTNTDVEGNFSFHIPDLPRKESKKDSLIVTYVGYESLLLPVKGKLHKLKIGLELSAEELEEVTVMAGKNPAIALLNATIDNEREARKQKGWKARRDSQVAWQLRKFPKKYEALLEDARKTLAATDSSLTDVPIFVSQHSSVRTAPSNGPIETTYLSEQKQGLGFDADGVFADIIGDPKRVVDDLFANNLMVMDKNIPSPLSRFWEQNYIAYLTDVPVLLNEQECHHITFEPIISSKLSFEGELWINLQDSSLVKAKFSLAKGATLNFLTGFDFEQTRFKNDMDIYQTAHTKYEQRLTNLPLIPEVNAVYEIIDHEAQPIINQSTDSEFMNINPNHPIATWENNAIETIKILEKKSKIGLFAKFGDILSSGYISTKYGDYGHLLNFLMVNDLEGIRTGIGVMSDEFFQNKLYANGYVGYGQKDETLKYNAELKWLINPEKRHILGVNYSYDLLPLSMVGFERTDLNMTKLQQFGKLSERAPFYYKVAELSYTKGLHRDWMISTFVSRKDFENANPLATESHPSFYSEEGSFILRWSFQDRSTYNRNYRLLRKGGQRFPEFKVGYTIGRVHNSIDSEVLPYQKVFVSLDHKFAPLLPWGGETSYRLQAGMVPSKVPYTHLKHHQGMEGPITAYGAHSLMNSSEFVSDYYAELFVRHLFKGTIMGRIPGLRTIHQKTGINFMFDASVAWGGMTQQNKDYNLELFQSGGFLGEERTEIPTLDPNEPYVAFGYGLNNIFKIAFIQYWHRVTYKDVPYAHDNEGIKAGLLFRL
ncbi:DUF5686 and carboxypeptidase-like regulatory domain-containing protein [Sediminitomix flava]|nr:DUF5686 and carboxypeptidase-like regulatory domain-containing protein [Sediminitomix flava]